MSLPTSSFKRCVESFSTSCFAKRVSNASRMTCGGKSVRLNEVSLFIGFDFSFRRLHSRLSLFDARQNVRHDLCLRLRALRAAVVEAHTHRAGFHVATTDDEHGVDAQLFRVGNLCLEWRRCHRSVENQPAGVESKPATLR